MNNIVLNARKRKQKISAMIFTIFMLTMIFQPITVFAQTQVEYKEELIPQSQMSATASSQEVKVGDYKANNVLDGKSDTIWHTHWSDDSIAKKFPYSITLNLGGSYDVSGLKCLPRQDSDQNGIIKDYNVYVSTDGTNFTKVATGAWEGNNTEKQVKFSAVKASYVKLEAVSAVGEWASAAEINIFRTIKQEIEIPETTPGDTADDDNDKISNSLEKNGFVVQNGEILPWNGDESVKHYNTDPLSWSTTGDPYGDGMKVTGLGMDNNVMDPAKTSPLVAAHPDVKVEMLGFDVIPIETISDKNGNSQQAQYTNSVATKDEQSHSGSITTKNGGSFKIGTDGIGKTFSYEVAVGYIGGRSFGTTSTVSDSTSNSINWESAKTTSSDKAAKLKLKMQYINVGTAPIKTVQVKFNVKLGNKLIATVGPDKWDEVPRAALLTTDLDKSQQKYGPIIIDRSNSTELFVTMDQLRAIQLGAAITVEPVEVKGTVVRWDSQNSIWQEISEWNMYNSQISAKTAKVIFEDANGKSKTFRVAAKHSYFDPHTTIGKALVNTVGGEQREDGIYIGGKKVTNGWSYQFSNLSEVVAELDKNVSENKGLLDVELKAGQTVVIHEPKANPSPVINWVKYSPDYKRVYASISQGDYGIKSVSVNVKVNGTVQNIPLEMQTDGAFYCNNTLFSSAADLSHNANIVVVDEKGNSVTKLIEQSEEKQGSKYVPLGEPKEIVSKTTTKNLLNGYIDAFLGSEVNANAVALQITSNRWSSQNVTVDTAGVKTELGTADVRPRSWKLKITDNKGKVHIIQGSNDLYELSDITTKGIDDNSIRKVELVGDPGFSAHFYESKNFLDETWRISTGKILNGEVDKNENGKSANNVISSLRVAYVGETVNDKRWYAWLTDFNGTKKLVQGKDWRYSDVSSVGIRNDELKRIEFIGHQDFDMYAFQNGISSTYRTKKMLDLFVTNPVEALMQSNFQVYGDTWKMNSGSVNHGNGVSGIYVMDKNYVTKGAESDRFKRGAVNSPIVSKTIVIPVSGNTVPISWSIQNAARKLQSEDTDAWIDVKLVGYFTDKENEGYNYKLMNKSFELTGLDNRNTELSTGVNAKGYLVEVKNLGISSDKVGVTVNGVTANLGASDIYLYDECKSYATSPTRNNLLFVPAQSQNPSSLRVSTEFSDLKASSNANPKIQINVVGYFGEDGDLVYVPKNEKLSNLGTGIIEFGDKIEQNHKPKTLLFNTSGYEPGYGSYYVYTEADPNVKFVSAWVANGSDVQVGNINKEYNKASGLLYCEKSMNTSSNSIIVGTVGSNIDFLGYFH